MARYDIKIDRNEKGYSFQLWYCGKQPMGYSKEYNSKSECLKGLDKFKDFIINNDIIEECKYLELKKIDRRKYRYQFIDEKGNILYKSRIIESRQSCKNSMMSTCKNIIHAIIVD